MEPVYISTRQCDGDFDELISPSIEDGRDLSQGVLLTMALPYSRPRGVSGSNPRLPQDEPLNIMTFKARCPPKKVGIYVLERQKEQEPIGWCVQAELQGQIVPETTKSSFIACLESSQSFGKHCPILKIDSLVKNTPVRRTLAINAWPIAKNDSIARLAAESGGLKDYRWFTISILTANAPVPMYTPVAHLHLIIYHHRGSPISWNIIPPNQKDAFESKIRQSFDIDPSRPICHQFVAHLNLWITQDTLKKWEIECHQLEQSERQAMAVFPGSYVWGFSTGFAVIEKKHWARHDWKAQDYPYCPNNTDLCKSAKPSTLTLDLPKEDIDSLKKASLQPQKKRHQCQKPRSKKRKLEELEDVAIEAKDFKTFEDPVAASSKPPLLSSKTHQVASWPTAIALSPPPSVPFIGKSNPAISSTTNKPSTTYKARKTSNVSSTTNTLYAYPDSEGDFIPTAVEKYTFNNPAMENKLLKEQLETIAKERDWLLQKNKVYKMRLAQQQSHIELLEGYLGVEENNGTGDIDTSDDDEGLGEQHWEGEARDETVVESSDVGADESDVWSEAELAPGFGERHGGEGDSDDEMMD